MGWDESPWQQVISAALVGTERQPFTVPAAPGKLGQLLSQLEHLPPEAGLLITAAMLSLHQRTGWLPVSSPVPVPAAVEDQEELPRCRPHAARLLQQMLQGQYSSILSEWLAIAANLGQRVPEMLLPELLDLGRQRQALRAAILPVLGQRGRWLAAQNPDWRYAVAVTTEADWETGNQAARLLYLQDLRSQPASLEAMPEASPEAMYPADRARALLQVTWKQEAAGDRAKFLETFRAGLSLADQPFLEEALGDRSKDVRRIAVDLLASLPKSRLCQQIAAYATRYVAVGQGQEPTINVELPTDLDATLIQSGIEPKPTKQVSANLGEKAWWLLQIIGAAPLTVWGNWGMSPAQIVRCARNHEWEAALLDGWALASKRQQNADWSEALLNVWMVGKESKRLVALPELGLEAVWNVLPADRQDRFLTDFLDSGRGELDHAMTLWLLCNSREVWSVDLAQRVLDRLQDNLSQINSSTRLSWELRSALKEFARFIPILLLPEVVRVRSSLASESPWMQDMEALLAMLQFRQEIAQAFERRNGR